jgi:predicted RNA binding protein YcfA (HicA-like mRNA interferase family)
MARLPRLSGREVVRVFESLGWEKVRQSSSHIILVQEEHQATPSDAFLPYCQIMR